MANKLTISILSFAPLLVGCNVAIWGNLAVLVISVGIFIGTISLGRINKATKGSSASAQSKEHP